MSRIAVFAACLVLSFAGAALAQDKGTIQKLNDKWAAAFKGDAAAVAAMYAEDAYVLPSGGEILKGRSAIEAFWRQAAQELDEAKLSTVDVLPLGPRAAREIGTVTLRKKPDSSDPPPLTRIVGKYAVVWRKIGGGWLIATDIWNSNK